MRKKETEYNRNEPSTLMKWIKLREVELLIYIPVLIWTVYEGQMYLNLCKDTFRKA